MDKARFRLPSLDIGWATNISPLLLEQNRGNSDLLQNIDVSTPGVPRKRPGVVEVLGATTNPIIHAKEYTNLETDETYIVVFDGDDWFTWDAGPPAVWNSFLTVVATATEADSLVFANRLALVDGTNASALFDGAAVDTPAQFPVARYLAEYRNRIVASGDPDEPSLLYLCHTGDPTIWNPDQIGSNATRMYVSPDDGEGITGHLNMGTGGVLIGKPSALYGLFGYARANMAVDLLDSTVGSLSHKAMQYIMPYAYFVSKQGIYRYTGSGGDAPERISAPIQDYFDANTDMDEIRNAVATVVGRYYLITLPQSGGGYYTLAYHTETSRWILWTAPLLGAYLYTDSDPDGRVYYSEPGEDQLYRISPGVLNDKGPTPINALIETRELDGGLAEVTKDFHDLYLICSGAPADYTVTVYMQADNGAWLTVGAATVNTPVRMQSVHRIVLARTARFLKFRFQNSTISQQFSPIGLTMTYTPKDVL